MRWIAVLCLAAAVGCSTERRITISTRPPDAVLNIDGADRGHGPLTEKFVFNGSAEIHHVTASRPGYTPQTVDVTRRYATDDLLIDLQPRTRQITVHVSPETGDISVDGVAQGGSPVSDLTLTLPFTIDESGQWTQHVIRASRPGWRTAERVVKWDDSGDQYELSLDEMRKDLSIDTTPPGATVTLDGRTLGRAPLVARGIAFPVDPKTGKFLEKTLVASRPGYDPVRTAVNWDNGRQDYRIELVPKTKVVRIVTDPPGGSVRIDGRDLPRDDSGATVVRLRFPPVDERGTLRTYNAVVTRKTAESEWVPEEITIGWDGGRADYSVSLEEVRTRQVPLLRFRTVREDDGWHVVPETIDTLAMKDVTEGPAAQPPERVTDLPAGSMIGSLAMSPDGQQVVYTLLFGHGRGDFRSQIQVVRADGGAAPTLFGDGRSLDLTPCFTPDGTQIVFSSNRGGRHLSIWQMAANGEGGVTQLTAGDTTDLWPSVDSDPKPRLYYQAMVDGRPDPRLYMTRLGTTLRTDLTQDGGEQPRVSPKADSVLFTRVNARTGRREIFRMSDQGGGAVNLTNTPEYDSFDPVWSDDGNRIAFVSDRGEDADHRHNLDIWLLDLAHPDKPRRITANGSQDDCPAWDVNGNYLYFRSNRGGNWAIWRIKLKLQADVHGTGK